MTVQPPSGPDFRLYRTGRQERYPPLTTATYHRLIAHGLRLSLARARASAAHEQQGQRGAQQSGAAIECAVAWVPSLVVGELVDALDAEGYVCWCWPHDAESGMSRLRVTRATPEEEAGCVP